MSVDAKVQPTGPVERQARGLSAAAIARIAAVLWVLSIASVLLVPREGDLTAYGTWRLSIAVVLELASWAAIPLFSWLLVLVLRRRTNPWLVAAGIALVALAAEVPYDLLYGGSWWDMRQQNPAWAYLFGVVIVTVLQYVRSKPRGVRIVVVGAVFLAAVLWCLLLNVGSTMGLFATSVIVLVMVLILASLWEHENTMMLAAGGFGAAAMLMPALGVVVLHFRKPLADADWHLPSPKWLAAYPLLLLVIASIAP